MISSPVPFKSLCGHGGFLKGKMHMFLCIDKNSCFVILGAQDAPFENAAACGLLYDREQFIGIPLP